MQTKSGALTVRPLWIITRYEDNRMDALTIGSDLGDNEKKKRWQSEQTTAGGLVSVLLGPCADVKGVALDPLPMALSREMLPLVSMSRDLFLQYLLEERRGAAEELAPSAS
jgi:hypothetical protein